MRNKHWLITPEYEAIAWFYGAGRAKRSRELLMKHIDKGCLIMEAIGASPAAIAGFCLHPLFQNDIELITEGVNFAHKAVARPLPIMFAMEYRKVANAYLLSNADLTALPELSILPEVNHMLIADKVQNRSDFELHHLGTHACSDDLVRYFNNWLRALDISEEKYQELAQL